MRLGEGKKVIEDDWKRQAAYALYGEPQIPTQQDLPEGVFAGSACSNRPARPNMPNEKKQ